VFGSSEPVVGLDIHPAALAGPTVQVDFVAGKQQVGVAVGSSELVVAAVAFLLGTVQILSVEEGARSPCYPEADSGTTEHSSAICSTLHNFCKPLPALQLLERTGYKLPASLRTSLGCIPQLAVLAAGSDPMSAAAAPEADSMVAA
jgi:hypothetical protein